ncbi:MAG: bifunctional UDP-sugar hydrolase/5'-nucleotidase [Synergistaceae bacterium]|nr:bifunctional UDP-sugar hydrolase/5'-nucleotidase [Synergistaceae bacterium]
MTDSGKMKFPLALLLAAVLFLFPAPLPAEASTARVPVLFLGDLHSQLLPVSLKANKTTVLFGGLVNGASLLARERSAEPSALVLQGGDAVSGIMWLHFAGEPEFSALETAGVQAFLLGNHEFNYGPDHLKKGLGRTSMAALASNLYFDDPDLAERVSRCVILESGKVKVGVFGIASPNLFAQASPGPGVHLNRNIRTMSLRMAGELREKGAEVVIALSRLSREENKHLAESVEGIHAILGGSSHEESPEPLFIRGPNGWETLLAESGAYGAFVGKLTLDVRNGRISRQGTTWSLLRVTPEAGSHQEVERIARTFEERLNEALISTVGIFENYADGRALTVRSGESPLGNFITDALRWRFRTDIGMINGGGIRGDRIFPAGNVSWKTLLEILPYNNPIHIVTLKGSQIRQILELSAGALKGGPDDHYDPNNRPHTGAFLQLSGLRVEYSLRGIPSLVDTTGRLLRWGNRLRSVAVLSGEEWVPLEDGREYTVAVNSWTAGGGDRLFVFAEGTAEKTDIRDIDTVAEYLMSRKDRRVRFEKDGRITITDS